MYIFDVMTNKGIHYTMHRNHPEHSNLENHWYCYIIWAPDLRNHQICKKILSLHRDFHIYKSMFYSFQSNGTKNKKVLVFSYSSYFFVTTGPIFYPMTSLWAAITSKRHPNRLHFLNFLWVLAPKTFRVENFRVRSILPKKIIFSPISVHRHKK